MCAHTAKSDRSFINSVVTNRCPRCREGKLFITNNAYDLKRSTEMPEHCPVCGQPYELQTGFYFGTGYVSYALSVALTGIFFAVCYIAGYISINDNSIYYWLAANAVLLILVQPPMARLSRSLWISFFVRHDPHYHLQHH